MKLSELENLGTAKGLVARIKELYELIDAISITGTTNEIEVTDNGDGTYTIGLPDNVTVSGDLTVGGDMYISTGRKLYLDA